MIARNKTASELIGSCRLDKREYPIGKIIPKEEWAGIKLILDEFHGDWNYTIHKQKKF
jgi:hypothetical protein